jgi:hypothetical protein
MLSGGGVGCISCGRSSRVIDGELDDRQYDSESLKKENSTSATSLFGALDVQVACPVVAC